MFSSSKLYTSIHSVFPISSHLNPMFFPRKALFLLTFPAQPSVNQRRQAPPAAILSALNATIGRALERKLREVAEHHGGEAAKIIENPCCWWVEFPQKMWLGQNMLKQEIQEMKNMIWKRSIVSEGQYDLAVVPYKAVAEVSKIGNL